MTLLLPKFTKDEVSDLIKANNDHIMASFQKLLKNTAGQAKRANKTSAEQQMKEIKKLKFQELAQVQNKMLPIPVQIQS